MSVALLSFVSVGTGVPMASRWRVCERNSEYSHSRQDDAAYSEVPPTIHSRFQSVTKIQESHQRVT